MSFQQYKKNAHEKFHNLCQKLVFDTEGLNSCGKQAYNEVYTLFSKYNRSKYMEWMNLFYNEHQLDKDILELLKNNLNSTLSVYDTEINMMCNNYDVKLPKLSEIEFDANYDRYFQTFRTEIILTRVYLLIKEKYGKYVANNPKWTYNMVGGIKARIRVLSMLANGRQYVALFGSPMTLTGESERYEYMDVEDIMIDGRMISCGEQSQTALERIYEHGEVSYLSKGMLRTYRMEGAYMIDFGHGPHGEWGVVFPAFLQGVIDPALYVDQDFEAAKQEIEDSLKSMTNGCYIM